MPKVVTASVPFAVTARAVGAATLCVIGVIGGAAVIAATTGSGAGDCPSATALAVVAAFVPAVVAAGVDARTGRLPDRLVALVAVPALVVLAAGTTVGEPPARAAAIVAGAVAMAGPLFVVHLVAPAALGFGDVKFGAALGTALGLVDARLGLVALAIASGLTASVGLATRRRELPLGPGLVAGAVMALALVTRFPLEAPQWW